jgi:hypothetical protein
MVQHLPPSLSPSLKLWRSRKLCGTRTMLRLGKLTKDKLRNFCSNLNFTLKASLYNCSTSSPVAKAMWDKRDVEAVKGKFLKFSLKEVLGLSRTKRSLMFQHLEMLRKISSFRPYRATLCSIGNISPKNNSFFVPCSFLNILRKNLIYEKK